MKKIQIIILILTLSTSGCGLVVKQYRSNNIFADKWDLKADQKFCKKWSKIHAHEIDKKQTSLTYTAKDIAYDTCMRSHGWEEI